MTDSAATFMLIGESDVGKTHYGAQLLRRLNSPNGSMTLENSDNLEPFIETMNNISKGLSGRHTPQSESTTSRWVVSRNRDKTKFELNWPDYGGEQVSSIINDRRMPSIWHEKIVKATAWAFMIRPSRVSLPEDVLTRGSCLPQTQDSSDTTLSAQSRLIEILQMLRFKNSAYSESSQPPPPMAVLLSCYDELNTGLSPDEYCRKHLPLLDSYLSTNWGQDKLKFFGVSPLGQPLSDSKPNEQYIEDGAEEKGYVVNDEKTSTNDLLLPIDWMLSAAMKE